VVTTRWIDHVRGIRQDPDSDAPRLVCADWLIDRGDPRGDYIALACRYETLPRESPEARALHELLQPFRRQTAEWLRPLIALGARRGSDVPSFTRGFVNRVRLFGSAASNLPAMCRSEPIVDLVLAKPAHNSFRVLADAPEISDLRLVTLEDDNPKNCEFLFASPFLANLPELQVLPGWTRPIADAAANGAIRPRRLRPEGLALPELAVLVAAGFFAQLEDYAQTRATDELVIELARAPLARLRRLTFDHAHVTAEAFQALGPRLDQLEHLSLGGRNLDQAIAAALQAHMHGGNLRSLRYGSATGEALDGFVGSPAFRGVEVLHVAWGAFNPAALERSPYRGQLRALHLGPGVGHVRVDLPGVEIRIDDNAVVIEPAPTGR
jgi:uncharacterized protein (TIGR02996 family)